MRSFTYDASGRITMATNPENGTTSWSYDSTRKTGHSAGTRLLSAIAISPCDLPRPVRRV
jgi:YD repeat-containing protein